MPCQQTVVQAFDIKAGWRGRMREKESGCQSLKKDKVGSQQGPLFELEEKLQ